VVFGWQKALQHLEWVQGSKLDPCMLTKFDHVNYGQSWGMWIDHMYIECITLVLHDMFLYYLYINHTYMVYK